MHTLKLRSFLSTVLLIAGCSHVDEITPRSYVGLIVGYAEPLRIEISKSLIASPGKSIPQAGLLRLPPPPGLTAMKFDFGWITESGVIIIQSKEYSVVVIQEPAIVQNSVTWNCVVHPSEAKPSLCGSTYENAKLHTGK